MSVRHELSRIITIHRFPITILYLLMAYLQPFKINVANEFSLRQTPARQKNFAHAFSKPVSKVPHTAATPGQSQDKREDVCKKEAATVKFQQVGKTLSEVEESAVTVDPIDEPSPESSILDLDFHPVIFQNQEFQKILAVYNKIKSQCTQGTSADYYQGLLYSLQTMAADIQECHYLNLSSKYDTDRDVIMKRVHAYSEGHQNMCPSSSGECPVFQWQYQPEDLYCINYSNSEAAFISLLGKKLSWLLWFKEQHKEVGKWLEGQEATKGLGITIAEGLHRLEQLAVQTKALYSQLIANRICITVKQAESLMYELTYVQDTSSLYAQVDMASPAIHSSRPKSKGEILISINMACSEWFMSHSDHPYLTRADRMHLALVSGGTEKQIARWFNNKRFTKAKASAAKIDGLYSSTGEKSKRPHGARQAQKLTRKRVKALDGDDELYLPPAERRRYTPKK